MYCCLSFCASIVLLSHQGGWDAGWEEQKHRTGAGKSYSQIFSLMTSNIYLTRLRPRRLPRSPCAHSSGPLFSLHLLRVILFVAAPKQLVTRLSRDLAELSVYSRGRLVPIQLGLLSERRAENKWLGKCDMRLSTTFIYKGNVVNSSRLNSACGREEEKKKRKNELLPPLKWLYF